MIAVAGDVNCDLAARTIGAGHCEIVTNEGRQLLGQCLGAEVGQRCILVQTKQCLTGFS